MLFFIASRPYKSATNPLPDQNIATGDPLANPVRKNVTAQSPMHVITIESRDNRIKPELINVTQLNNELTKIGFWDKEGLNFHSPVTSEKITTGNDTTGVTANALKIIIEIDTKAQKTYLDPKQKNAQVGFPSINTTVGTESDTYVIKFIIHPYMLNFNYEIIGSHISYMLLKEVWHSAQNSITDQTVGHSTTDLYALKILKATPDFSFIQLRK